MKKPIFLQGLILYFSISVLLAGKINYFPEQMVESERKIKIAAIPRLIHTKALNTPEIFSSINGETEIIYYEDFEKDWNGWTTHDGTLPNSMWHLDGFSTPDGTGLAWWMGDPDLGGYFNDSYIVLDTDEITVMAGGQLTFDLKYNVEAPDGAESPYNGWDGCNVRLSIDGGATWTVISGTPSYERSSLYSFGFSHGEGAGIPGWVGSSNGWVSASFDLSAYEGQSVRIRFAFASDGGHSTQEDSDLFGMIVDNIFMDSFSNDGVDQGMTTGSMVPIAGNIWALGEPGDAPSPTHAAICQDGTGSYSTGLLDYLISPVITLPEDGEIQVDFMLKGNFSDNDEFPDADFWGWEVSPDAGVTWFHMSNPYGKASGYNYVYIDAPDSWSSVVGSYSLEGRIDDYIGMDVQFRISFETDDDDPIGTGIMIDDFTITNTTYLASPTNLLAVLNINNGVDLIWDDLNVGGNVLFYYGDINQISYPNFVNGSQALWYEAAPYSGWFMQYTAGIQTDLSNIYYAIGTGNDSLSGELVPIKMQIWTGMSNLVWESPEFTPEAMDTLLSYDVSGDSISVLGDFYVGWVAEDTTQPFILVDLDSPHDAAFGKHGSNSGLTDLSGSDWDGNYAIFADGVQGGANVTYNVYHTFTSGSGYTLIGTSGEAAFTHSDPGFGVDNFYVVSAVHTQGESQYSNEVSISPVDASWQLYAHDDGSSETGLNVNSGNFLAVRFDALAQNSVLRISWFQVGSGGALYLKIFDDNNGVPGTEIFSKLKTSGVDGWNNYDLDQNVIVSGPFWLGIKEFSSSMPTGIDTDSNVGNSYFSIDGGNTWEPLSNYGISGNVMLRTYLGDFVTVDDQPSLVEKFSLSKAYPNPFNPVTSFEISLPNDGVVTINIYNIKGQLVERIMNQTMMSGIYTLSWNAKIQPSGIYFIQMSNGNEKVIQKVLLVK